MADLAVLAMEIRANGANRATSDLQRVSAASRRAEAASNGVTDGSTRASDSLRKMGQAAASIDGPLGGVASRFRSLGMLIRQTNVATVALTLAFGAAVVGMRRIGVEAADTWSDLSARIGLAVGNLDRAPAVMERISQIARRTYSDVGLTAESFLRVSTTLRELGKNTTQQLDFTESLNNALVVSGAKAERAAQVQEALGRAMALGALRGQELNTVIQTGGRVAEVIAAELGVGVNQLRKLGEQGKITGQIIYDALTKRLEQLREEADRMPATIGDAMTLLRNSLLKTIGIYDQNAKLSERVAQGVIAIADSLDLLIKAALGVAVVFSGRIFASIGKAAGETAQFWKAVAVGDAVLKDSATANAMRAKAVLDGARADRAAAAAKVRDVEATVAQLKQTLELAKTQKTHAAVQVDLARGRAQGTKDVEAINRALEAQNKATRTALVTQRALRASEAELAASRARLAVATNGATRASVQGFIQSTSATVGLVAAEKAHQVALAQTTVAARAATIAMKGLQTVVAFFGGWLGVAFTAVAVALGVWATRASEATRAMESHKAIVESIREAYERAGKASQDWAKNVKDGSTTQAIANLQAFERELQEIQRAASSRAIGFGTRGAFYKLDQGTLPALRAITDQFRAGELSAQEFKAAIDRIAQSDLKLPQSASGDIAKDLLDLGDKAKEAEEKILKANAALLLIRGNASKAEQENALKLLGIEDTKVTPPPAAEDNLTKALAQMRQRVRETENETKVIGLSTFAAERYLNMQKLVQAAIKDGLPLTDARLRYLDEEATKMARVTAAYEAASEAQQRLDDVRGTFQSSFSGFVSDIAKGTSALESFASALSRIADKFLNMAADNIFESMFGKQGTSNSFFGNLANGSSKGGLLGGVLIPGILHQGGVVGNDNYPSRAVPSAAFANAQRYHNGGIAGLKPNEVPAILEKGEMVIPKSQVGQQGGAGIVVNIGPTTIDASGADPEAIRRLEAAMVADRQARRREIVEVVRDAQARRIA